ncbi:hypothetical protein HYW67_01750 [Candidatus Parcubacteria bacterium]|nr:hypothetical protein [Candidatus Parcubacteria bacterium]
MSVFLPTGDTRPYREGAGFTIIEGLVVLAVIAIVSTLVLANLRFGQKKTTLDNEILRFTQLVRRAKTNSLGSVAFQGSVPGGGYGVSIDTGEADTVAILFADNNGSTGNQAYDGAYDRCNQECVERFVFSSGIHLRNVQPAFPLRVIFLPPNLATVIRAGAGSGADAAEARVTISWRVDPDLAETVVIKNTGEIVVE